MSKYHHVHIHSNNTFEKELDFFQFYVLYKNNK